jgi:hypothetical protein
MNNVGNAEETERITQGQEDERDRKKKRHVWIPLTIPHNAKVKDIRLFRRVGISRWANKPCKTKRNKKEKKNISVTLAQIVVFFFFYFQPSS